MTVPDHHEVNVFRRKTFGQRPGRLVAFVCECADAECRKTVVLSALEYDQARATACAIVHPSHAATDSGA